MIDENRIKQADYNVKAYLSEGLLKKEFNQRAFDMYIKNSDTALLTADKLMKMEDENYKPHLWIIVCSYYSMFYIASAALLKLGYRVGHKMSHSVVSDSLISFVREKLKKRLLENFEEVQEEALEITRSKTDEIIKTFDFERKKRSMFQYEMSEDVKASKAKTSLERSRVFTFELKKLL